MLKTVRPARDVGGYSSSAIIVRYDTIW